MKIDAPAFKIGQIIKNDYFEFKIHQIRYYGGWYYWGVFTGFKMYNEGAQIDEYVLMGIT